MKTSLKVLAVSAIAAVLSPVASATPQDEAAISTLVEGVAVIADRSEFAALERLFAEEVMVDYSSLSGAPAETKTAQQLMTEWAGVLPGFDRTRHAISGIVVKLDGSEATATAQVTAGHWIDGAYWEVVGSYDYSFARIGSDWKITAMTLNFESETGSRDVFGPAIEAAAKNPVSYLTE